MHEFFFKSKLLKYIFIFVIFFFFNFSNTFSKEKSFIPDDVIKPYCLDFFHSSNTTNNIEYIEIKVNNNKQWNKNLFNLYIYFKNEQSKSSDKNWYKNFRINNKYKKKYKSQLIVKFKDSNLCKFNANVKVTGDLWWHIDWKNNGVVPSLQVEILDGHINNIVEFKLLLPEARYNDNEIFTTSLFSYLGFLSPKTFYQNVKINGKFIKYIFQEDIRKEFIETNNLREGPLLEGDERFTIDLIEPEKFFDKRINLSRLINKNFAKKNDNSSFISLDAVESLNQLYLVNHSLHNHYGPDFLYMLTDILSYNKSNKIILQEFDALTYALDAEHGLSFDDRRFYFDSIQRSFLPIYYDGKSNILEKDQLTPTEDLALFASVDAKIGAKNILHKLNLINEKTFLKILKNNGLELDDRELKITLDKIKYRLNVLINSKPKNLIYSKNQEIDYFSKFNENKNYKVKLVLTNYNLKEFYICNFKISECETVKVTSENYKNYLASAIAQDFQAFKDLLNKEYKYLFLYSYFKMKSGEFLENSNISYWEKKELDNNVELIYNQDVTISLDNLNKKILIFQKNLNGKVLFKNGSLNSFTIEFRGIENFHNLSNKLNNMSLTGCLNFYNLDFKNVNLLVENSNCEDAINIIKSKGVIDRINVANAVSDGVDFDFSEIKIKSANIKNSFNDCFDVSYGIYEVDYLELLDCNDKAISVGEKSFFKAKSLNVNRAKIAIASKDTSNVKISSANINNALLCFAAYRKKQEFSGAYVSVEKSNCKNEEKIYASSDSIIEIK